MVFAHIAGKVMDGDRKLSTVHPKKTIVQSGLAKHRPTKRALGT